MALPVDEDIRIMAIEAFEGCLLASHAGVEVVDGMLGDGHSASPSRLLVTSKTEFIVLVPEAQHPVG